MSDCIGDNNAVFYFPFVWQRNCWITQWLFLQTHWTQVLVRINIIRTLTTTIIRIIEAKSTVPFTTWIPYQYEICYAHTYKRNEIRKSIGLSEMYKNWKKMPKSLSWCSEMTWCPAHFCSNALIGAQNRQKPDPLASKKNHHWLLIFG